MTDYSKMMKKLDKELLRKMQKEAKEQGLPIPKLTPIAEEFHLTSAELAELAAQEQVLEHESRRAVEDGTEKVSEEHREAYMHFHPFLYIYHSMRGRFND